MQQLSSQQQCYTLVKYLSISSKLRPRLRSEFPKEDRSYETESCKGKERGVHAEELGDVPGKREDRGELVLSS